MPSCVALSSATASSKAGSYNLLGLELSARRQNQICSLVTIKEVLEEAENRKCFNSLAAVAEPASRFQFSFAGLLRTGIALRRVLQTAPMKQKRWSGRQLQLFRKRVLGESCAMARLTARGSRPAPSLRNSQARRQRQLQDSCDEGQRM